MKKNLSKNEINKLKIQMGISDRKETRPPVGRPTVFFGKTSKQSRRDGKR